MKSLITTGNGTVELIDLPDPVAGPGEILVVPIAAGICGTDLHEYVVGAIVTLERCDVRTKVVG